MISVARLLALGPHVDGPIDTHAEPARFLPETLSGLEMLEQLRARSGRLAFVVDEYGVVQGMMTPHDLLEAITGELKPDADVEAWATPTPDGSWLLDGLMPISELKARLDIDELPAEDKNRYNTLGGLLMSVLGRMPQAGEQIECAGWIFEIRRMQGRRIDKIKAHPALVADTEI